MTCIRSVTSVIFFLNSVLLSHQTYQDTSTTVVYKWKTAEFEYSNEKAKNDAIKKGQLTPENVLILDADYYAASNRYFVTTPQFRNGTPATLSEVVKGKNDLKPFPNWPSNNKCQGPFSVFRINIDKCGLMWVPDSGKRDILSTGKSTCQPKLLVYDLSNKDKETLNYAFPNGVFTDRSLLINVVTESYQKDCSDSIAYIADVLDHGLIVFDYARKSSYRIENRYFYIYPPSSIINTNGVTFDSTDGVFGLALGPSNERNRKLYFHSFASVHESWVPVSVLKNQTQATDDATARSAFVLSPGQRTGQSSTQVMTDDGILIYALIPTNSLACWNSRTSFTGENQHVLHRDNENFQFISGMKLISNKLVIMSSRFQNFNVGILNGTDYKYRIVVIEDVKRLLQNTPCTSGSGDNWGGGDNTNGGYGIGSNSGSHASHGGSYGGNSCYGASCERPQSSQSHGHKPSGTNSGIVFKPHTKPHSSGRGVKTKSGDSDDSSSQEVENEQNQVEVHTSEGSSAQGSTAAYKARALW